MLVEITSEKSGLRASSGKPNGAYAFFTSSRTQEKWTDEPKRYLMQRGRFPARPPGNCLERSLVAYRLLCAVGSDPRLVVGARPGDRGVDGHVWIVLDGRPFAEVSDVPSYASVVAFDARGRREATVGDGTDLTGVRWA